jgi:hypothetical protein
LRQGLGGGARELVAQDEDLHVLAGIAAASRARGCIDRQSMR